ncbi:MAG TPA: ABC transporter permease [Reyranella sp.]|nr:ABC transporter permease [Reyranella sp.]
MRSMLARCLAEPRVRVGGGLMLALLLIAIFAPWLAPHDPGEQDLLHTLLPPAWAPDGDPAFLLGTDSLGRDVLSRLIFGTRVAMHVAIVAALGAALLGSVLALIAGYYGGRADWIIGRAVDVWMSFPPVILSLILMVGFGAGLNNVILAIVIVDWTRFCRVVRSEVMTVRRRDYIPAARLAGFTHLQVILKEIVPAVTPLLLTLISIEMGIAVVVEAILSFVGLSVEPNVAAWGVMIADARQSMHEAPWGLIAPVVGIFVSVLAANLLGDGLRRSVDPRLAQRLSVLR